MQQEIFDAIKAALMELGSPDVEFVVERPADMSHGDYATNVALVAAKKLGKNPKEVAEEFQKKLLVEGVAKVEVAGPGFINFYLSRDAVVREVQKATSDAWGKNDLYKGKTVMVEYTQPNPFKEFHIGHLMSNTLGESVARLLEVAGAEVLRANYQGDVGPHVAKAMRVLLDRNQLQPSVSEISAAYVEGARLYEEDTSQKEAIDQLNKLIYQQYEGVTDEKLWQLYQYGRTLTLEHFEELYRVLGTKFDFYFFESETGVRGLAMVRAHADVFTESEGAIVFHGEEYGLHTRVFINRLGLPTYEAKDLGLAELKKEKAKFDISITTTATEQNEYFKVIFKALELIHPEWTGQFKHVSHGMMRFAEGKMSSRKGNVITGESLLMDLKDEAREKIGERPLSDVSKVAEEVAVGAIKYAVLKQGSGRDIIFDPEKSLSLEGDSGPYLQYARVRANAILKKIKLEDVIESVEKNDAWLALARALVHYPEVVARAAKELEPHYVTTYLTELASAFNSLYGAEQFIVDGQISKMYFDLIGAFVHTMSAGLYILGIPAPQEM